jgi:hypothetical protein
MMIKNMLNDKNGKKWVGLPSISATKAAAINIFDGPSQDKEIVFEILIFLCT